MCMGFDLHTWYVWQKLHMNIVASFFYLHLCITLPYSSNYTWIINLMTSFFLQSSSPYAGSGSTNKVVAWFNLLAPESRGYVWEASFEPIIIFLLEKSISATLVQCLIERWWDTTHTFHIIEQEMMMTPYDFYRMTGHSFEGATNSLDSVSGVQLGLNMLGRKYSTKTIPYIDLVLDYMFLPQRTMEECVHMARAFLLHLLPTFLPIVGNQCL